MEALSVMFVYVPPHEALWRKGSSLKAKQCSLKKEKNLLISFKNIYLSDGRRQQLSRVAYANSKVSS